MRLIINLLLSLLFCCSTSAAAWAAETGVSTTTFTAKKDLRQWQPRKGELVDLDGPWTLYWQQLLTPDRLAANPPTNALKVSIPAQWKSYTMNGQALPNEGYATYRMTFTLSDEPLEQPLALYLNNVASAYRLWVNGQELNGNGIVGMDAAHMVARSYPKIQFFVPHSGDNEIVIQVSNFAQRTGGIWENIHLGDAEIIASKHRGQVMLWTLITGCLLLMTVFSIFLYLARKQDRAALWFGLICLAICVRSSLLGESSAYVLFPWLSWEWGVKLEYLSEIATILNLAAFVNKQYPQEAVRRSLPLFAIALSGFAAFVLVTPAKVYTQYMVPYVIILLLPVFLYVMYVYLRAALRRRTGSRTNMIGFIVFFAAVIEEILYYVGYLQFGGLVSFGLLFFLLTQLLNLSLLFTRAVTQSELLSNKLDQVIASQEATIKQRTSSLLALNLQLEQGNQELSRIELARSTLLAEVYHDLSTPITAIKGLAKGIKAGVIPQEEAPTYAGRIYERSLMLERLIDNVIELSNLRTGEVQLQLAEIPLLPFLRQLTHRYAPETAAQHITLTWEEPSFTAPQNKDLIVRMDRFRFERVFANLISNAVKYTAGEGTVRVWTDFRPRLHDPEHGLAIIHVSDYGIGIPEAELPHIFKHRYRVTGSNNAAGSGLGLAICQEIVARHGGEIRANSTLGVGTDFHITLPATFEPITDDSNKHKEGDAHGHAHSAH
ncbi:ATP-binding protein [Paenibacillus oryzisoli]|uniref:sensor histidine kinase n=1 Tax=Paenibacillus oryzisoli TaxID=1850517 RepID=UPI003D29247E